MGAAAATLCCSGFGEASHLVLARDAVGWACVCYFLKRASYGGPPGQGWWQTVRSRAGFDYRTTQKERNSGPLPSAALTPAVARTTGSLPELAPSPPGCGPRERHLCPPPVPPPLSCPGLLPRDIAELGSTHSGCQASVPRVRASTSSSVEWEPAGGRPGFRQPV